MRILHGPELIKEVIRLWNLRYPAVDERGNATVRHPSVIQATRCLNELDPNKTTPAMLDSIIGSTSWTLFDCAHCGKSTRLVVEVGTKEVMGAGLEQVYLCFDCVREMARLVSGYRPVLPSQGLVQRPVIRPTVSAG